VAYATSGASPAGDATQSVPGPWRQACSQCLLSWEPSPEIIRSWEGAAAAPPGDVLAACDILMPPGLSATVDEVAIAVSEAEADRALLLADPAPTVIGSLCDELRQLAGGQHRTPRNAFRTGRDSRPSAWPRGPSGRRCLPTCT